MRQGNDLEQNIGTIVVQHLYRMYSQAFYPFLLPCLLYQDRYHIDIMYIQLF